MSIGDRGSLLVAAAPCGVPACDAAALGRISPGMLGKARPCELHDSAHNAAQDLAHRVFREPTGSSELSSEETESVCRQPDLADSCQIHMLFSAPKVILILHGEPTFRGSSQRL